MKTLDLSEASDFLKVHPSTLLEKTRTGAIPGRKVGRAWVYLEDELVAYLRALTYQPIPCRSTSAVKRGTRTSPSAGVRDLGDLLGLPTRRSRKDSTMS